MIPYKNTKKTTKIFEKIKKYAIIETTVYP